MWIMELGSKGNGNLVPKKNCDSLKYQKCFQRLNFGEQEFTDPSLVLISHVGERWNSNFFIVQKVNCKWFKWNVVLKPQHIFVLGLKSNFTSAHFGVLSEVWIILTLSKYDKFHTQFPREWF